MRTPTNLNEPPVDGRGAERAGSGISILDNVVFSTGAPTVANSPVAPSTRMGSWIGIAPATKVVGEEVMGEGYEILNVVAVVDASARTDPDTRIPAPSTPGSAVCALRFV